MSLVKTPNIWGPREYCLKCLKCCLNTKMILLEEDIKRISNLGFKAEDFAVRSKEGFYVLKNVDGRCYFLDKEKGRCTIYPYRPLGCSLYPIVIDSIRGDLAIDKFCPLSATTTPLEIRKARKVLKKILRELRLE